MSHYIYVETPEGDELSADIPGKSGDISDLYEALGASECNSGVSGDGIKRISRETVIKARNQYIRGSEFYEFLNDVLSESHSEEFIFHFS